ncbi:MAG: (d)CMP kinase [Clostridiales bacterium]|nr:(d)CMP kinase [Clostridiales bacterium]
MRIQVSIDGPAGAGKSTIAKALAQKLGFIHIDTGAMYRAVTWLALREKMSLEDEEGLIRLARNADIRMVHDESGTIQMIDGQGRNLTEEIRSRQVNAAVSQVAAIAGVREALVDIQRKMAENQNVIMDGRDIGTVVLPHAECKIYLTATAEERARRRKKEREGKDQDRTLEEIAIEIRKRDEEDMRRTHSPLRKAEDSIVLDTTALSFQEAVEAAAEIVLASKGVSR